LPDAERASTATLQNSVIFSGLIRQLECQNARLSALEEEWLELEMLRETF